jgi:hypothetical protein
MKHWQELMTLLNRMTLMLTRRMFLDCRLTD